MMGKSEAWVTLALENAEGVKALVLAKSLRRVCTTRSLIALVSDKISPRILNAIRESFDGVFKIDDQGGTDKIPEQIYSKLFCWTLSLFSTCVYLDPEIIAVKNSDELFNLNTKEGELMLNANATTVAFHPCLKTFRKLVENSSQNSSGSFGEILRKTYDMNRIQHFSSTANYDVCIGDEDNKTFLSMDERALKLVKVKGIHLDLSNGLINTKRNLPVAGLLENSIWKYWSDLFDKEVLPILNGSFEKNQLSQFHSSGLNQFITPIYPTVIITSKTLVSAEEELFSKRISGEEEPIAIIGMSCRFPMANSIPEFWELLLNGVDAIGRVKNDRGHTSSSEYLHSAGFLSCPLDQFDAKFFGISPAELSYLDPQARLLLEVVWEALEDAGISPNSLFRSRTGVFTGIWTQDYKELISEVVSPQNEYFRKYMGNGFGNTSGRISHLLGLSGPNISTESGCSSSMIAVDLACQNLKSGSCDLAFASGVNIILHAFDNNSIEGLIAPDGRCKTFDAKADGFGRGEGCATLVLKRYSHAKRDGDKVLGLIKGIGVAQEGISRSFGTPTVETESMAMKLALENANVHHLDVSYVEVHGTGTPVGDPLEIAAITSAYGKDRTLPLTIGSVKTNIGHSESCAGIAGIIKTVLSMKHEIIPAHLNLETLNPAINLDLIPAEIPTSPKDWPRHSNHPRIAGVSCFGISGTDSHLILQEAPEESSLNSFELKLTPRPQHVVTISAKSGPGLDALVNKYSDYFGNDPEESLGDISYSINTGRSHFANRIAVTGKTKGEILKKLATGDYVRGCAGTNNEPSKLCFLFTGQGCHYLEMGQVLYKTCPTFRLHFDLCDSIMKNNFDGLSVLNIPKDVSKLSNFLQSVYMMVPSFFVQICLAKLWESWGVKPDFVLGHSLGEYAAAVVAGIMTVKDGLQLLLNRSHLIDTLTHEGKMLVVKSNRDKVQSLLRGFLKEQPEEVLDFAAVNSNSQVVLSGLTGSISKFSKICLKNEIPCQELHTLHAFHSSLMSPIKETCIEKARSINFLKSNYSFISGMTGKLLQDSEFGAEYLGSHLVDTVEFMQASQTALNLGCNIFIEIGPQPVLSAFVTGNNFKPHPHPEFPLVCLPSLRKGTDDWTVILESLTKLYIQGFPIDWKSFDQFLNRKKISGLPNYPFQRKSHWFESPKKKHALPLHSTLQSSKVQVHPLTGNLIPSVSPSKLFQSYLRTEDIPYVKDHCIGSQVLLPGAAYIEMALAAGHLASQGNSQPKFLNFPANALHIENLKIDAPMELKEGESYTLQTLVQFQESPSESLVSIYKMQGSSIHNEDDDDNNISWVKHSIGNFSVASSTFERLSSSSKKIYQVEAPLGVIEASCSEEIDPGVLYQKLDTLGQNFGPLFKSLKTIKRNSSGSELFAKVNLFPCEDSQKYFCHPVVIDAMIQAFCLTKLKSMEDLHVPVNIGKFTWFAKPTEESGSKSGSGFIHSFIQNDTPSEDEDAKEEVFTVLYDSTGKLLAVLSDVQLIRTSLTALKNALDKQSVMKSVGLYEEVWRERPGPLESRVDLLQIWQGIEIVPENIEPEVKAALEVTEDMKKTLEVTNRLCYLYILKAMYQLGWPVLTSGTKITFQFEQVTSHLSILPCHHKLLQRFLQILEEEGLLQKAKGQGWVFNPEVKKPLTLPHCLEEISQCVQSLQGNRSSQAVILCGEKLPLLLQGQSSALDLLFSEDAEGSTPASSMYKDSYMVKMSHKINVPLLQNIFKNYLHLPPEGRGTLRILEVGAGTGSGTELLLNTLQELGIKYTLTFTDLSASFFPKTSKKFQSFGDKMIFKILNIENDPLTQGFAPEEFDLIFGAFVLHATKDLKESLRNLNPLLKPGGMVYLLENSKPVREFDLTFGLVDGYWRFEDFNLRPEHCLVPPEVWKEAFLSQGYGHFQHVTYHFGDSCVLIGTKMEVVVDTHPLHPVQQDKWVLFSNEVDHVEELRRHFESVGRDLVWVKRRKVPKQISRLEFEIRGNEKSDLELIFAKIISDQGGKVEGILYAWTLEPHPLGSTAVTLFQEDVALPYLNLSQVVCKLYGHNLNRIPPTIYVATRGASYFEGQTPPTAVTPSTVLGMLKCWRLEGQLGAFGPCIDLDPQGNTGEVMAQLFSEVWTRSQEAEVAYRAGKRFVKRLIPADNVGGDSLKLPNSEGYVLKLPESHRIDDLQFVPLTFARGSLKDHEIEIRIKASGLNFKDVFVVLKLSAEFKHENSIGYDFAGVVTAIGSKVTKRKVGDAVFGCNFIGGALPSMTHLDENAVMTLPDNMTYCEGATLPAVFATAYHCLVDIAALKENQTILIHAASGGVGLAAIQIAKALQAKIIATAGSARKRSYLKSIGIEHVFHSRNTTFEQDIQRVTQGSGVDLVLNSLTGPGFKQASLNSLKKSGYFVEMSRLDIWTCDEVRGQRPDVNYKIVDLTLVSGETWMELFKSLEKYLATGKLVPLPYQRFEIGDIRQALDYFRKAKHIGKVVVSLPNRKFLNGQYETKEMLFNPRSSYLITGAFGGVGLEVVKWMVEKGAKCLILVGRNPPRDKVNGVLSQLRSLEGVKILCQFLDIGDFAKCQELISSVVTSPTSGLPPLRGVMHAAGTLSDALMDKLVWPDFEKTFRSKVKGTLNLHEVTKALPLEHFVLYSTCGALIGNTSQATHAAANSFMDSLARYRHSVGLSALSVNWGQWGQVGVASELRLTGVTPFTPSQAFGALETLLKSRKYQGAVMDIDVQVVKKVFPLMETYLEEIKHQNDKNKGGDGDFSLGGCGSILAGFQKEYCEQIADEGKFAVAKKYIELVLRTVLKLDPEDVIDENQNFLDMGLDSLMMIEMKNCIQLMTKGAVVLDVAAMAECQTVRAMSRYLHGLLLLRIDDFKGKTS